MNQMDISFVIIEYHCLDEVRQCIAVLQGHAGDCSPEIIVSSNSAYQNEMQNRIKTDFPGTDWLFNEKNHGFAHAMNRGIEKAAGDTIVLVNPDSRLTGPIAPACRFLSEHPEIAVLGPKIVNQQGEIQDSARSFMTPWGLARRSLMRWFRRREMFLEKNLDYKIAQPVDWVIGAFMMIKKSALEKVGLLDEKYFLYVEDMDWCKRFWDKGLQVFYFPDLTVEYAGSRLSSAFVSKRSLPNRYAIYHLRSYLRFVCKHHYFIEKKYQSHDPKVI